MNFIHKLLLRVLKYCYRILVKLRITYQSLFKDNGGGQLEKRSLREKEKWKVYTLGGIFVFCIIFCIFELPRLDLLQFQHGICLFSVKKGLLLRGQNPSVGGGGVT